MVRGKSTLMNILFGVYAPTSGELIFEGESLLPFDTVKAPEAWHFYDPSGVVPV